MPNINYKFPLSKGKNSYFEFNETIKDAVKENIKNVLFTPKGSRVIYKDYGTLIQRFLFEQQTPQLKAKIKNEIVESLAKWVKGISLTGIDVLYKEDIRPDTPWFGQIEIDEYSVLITIYYEVNSSDGNFVIPRQSISFKFDKQ